ncbi:MAG: NUDIX hydrolase [Chloroflexaceae bacterium]|jgi:ADP-ribose pyrophosphatase YjhB (NUDIX family)|nr:NUDIX hydrolase [Chloroflexaceae bacterium]
MAQDEPIRAAGGVVYCLVDGMAHILLIQDKYGVWTLPKGHLEPGETEECAATREIAEETGICCTLVSLIQRVQYPVYKKSAWRDKQVAYFLAQAEHVEPSPQADEGINAARWFAANEAVQMPEYAQVRDVVRRGLALLTHEPQS